MKLESLMACFRKTSPCEGEPPNKKAKIMTVVQEKDAVSRRTLRYKYIFIYIYIYIYIYICLIMVYDVFVVDASGL